MSGTPFLYESLALPTRHAVVDEADGRVRVKGVPIFAEVTKPRYGRTHDRAWLKNAVSIDKANRQLGGYSAPLHFRHHEGGLFGGTGAPPERAGDFELQGVKLRYYLGKPLWVVFGDLVYKDRETYARALKDFPYRSVEISPEKPDQISSLALLDSDAPFFQFPNLGAKNVEQDSVACYSLAGGGDFFLWRGSVDPNAKKKDESTPEGPAEKAAAEPGEAPAAKDPTLSDVMAAVQALHALVAKAIEGSDQESMGAGGGQPSVQTRAPVVAAQAAREDSMDAKEKAELEGKLAAMTATIDGLKAKAEQGERFSALLKSLEGYSITPAIESKIREYASKGPGVGEAFVEAYKLSTPKAPNSAAVLESVGGAAPAAPAKASPDEAAVEKYSSDPVRLERARRLAWLWANDPAVNAFKVDAEGKPRTLEVFLASNVEG